MDVGFGGVKTRERVQNALLGQQGKLFFATRAEQSAALEQVKGFGALIGGVQGGPEGKFAQNLVEYSVQMASQLKQRRIVDDFGKATALVENMLRGDFGEMYGIMRTITKNEAKYSRKEAALISRESSMDPAARLLKFKKMEEIYADLKKYAPRTKASTNAEEASVLVRSSIDDIKTIVGEMGDILLGAARPFLIWLKKFIKDPAGAIADLFKGLLDGIVNKIMNMMTFMMDTIKGMFKGIFKGMFGWLGWGGDED